MATNEEDQAKAAFEKGVALALENKCAEAIPYFLESRRLAPSWDNTYNAAFCLGAVGRYDEALDLHEIAAGQFAKDVPEDQRLTIPDVLARDQNKVGVIDLSSRYMDLSVWVDGVLRQDRPHPRRLRVMPGKHTLRFVRNGFEPLEVTVEIEAGSKTILPVELKPTSGWLRVDYDAINDEKMQLFLDGLPVGAAPWEGNVSPGPHIVWAEGLERGTAPQRIEAEKSKIVETRLQPGQLEDAVLIEIEPAQARISFAGIEVAKGQLRARLPRGTYEFQVSAPNYMTKTIQLTVPSASKSMKIRLAPIPPAAKPATLHWWIGAFGGYAGGLTLGSGAESYCPDACSSSSGVHGLNGGFRGGFDLPAGGSVEAAVGYLWLGSWLSRTLTDRFDSSQQFEIKYAVDDALIMRGPFGTIGGSYRWNLGHKGIHLRTRLQVGLMGAFSYDNMDVTVSAGGQSAPVKTKSDSQPFHFTGFVQPEIAAEWRWGSFDVGASLGAAIFFTRGPHFDHPIPLWDVSDKCPSPESDTLNCAAANDVFSNELTHGIFAVLMPQVSIRKKF